MFTFDSSKILFFIALPSILIQLFVLGFIKDTKVLMFIIGCMLSIIILTIFLFSTISLLGIFFESILVFYSYIFDY